MSGLQILEQLGLALFGLTAMWLSMCSKNPRHHKIAPIVGLCGQPFWAWFAWRTQSPALALLVPAFAAVYVNGILVRWRA
jgi:hypothetical protein